jgi:nicotinate-nucleotide adenylyltransferase
MKRIGIFGGTFNPIHLGHLRSAEEIHEMFRLSKVIFVPSSDPPHKKKKGILPGSVRARMVRLAIAGHPPFALSELELKRPGKSYSIETISAFRRFFGQKSSLYFIVGLDAFLEIATWKKYLRLFELCHFVVMTRPSVGKIFSREHLPIELANAFCYDSRKNIYTHSSGYRLFPREITALDISSTQIRTLLQKGRSVKYLVPRAVEEFIRKNKLYSPKGIDLAD